MDNKFLLDNGYKQYPQHITDSYTKVKTIYAKSLTVSETKSFCDLNESLSVNVLEFQMLPVNGRKHPKTYEVYIRAEKDDLWWDLKAYSLNFDDLEKKLPIIEKKLIKMFNSIKNNNG